MSGKVKTSALLIVLFCLSCSNKTKINSKNIKDKEERIEKLKPEITTYSKIIDAEFDLFNSNGFRRELVILPGSTSIDYKFAVRVDPNDIAAWMKGLEMAKGNMQTEKWFVELIKLRENNWKTISEPVFYKRVNSNGSVTIIIFLKEGIIYKHVSQG